MGEVKRGPYKTKPRPACGTTLGYYFHKRAKEIPCDPCRTTYNEVRRVSRAANPDKRRETDKQWRLANLERFRQTQAKHRARHSVEIQAYNRQYRIKNSEVRNLASARWKANNPERVKEMRVGIDSRRRARKFGVGHEVYTTAQVLELHGIACHICSGEIDLLAPRRVGQDNWQRGLHLDHVVPLSRGGADNLRNVRPAHALCNLKKNNRRIEEEICA